MSWQYVNIYYWYVLFNYAVLRIQSFYFPMAWKVEGDLEDVQYLQVTTNTNILS